MSFDKVSWGTLYENPELCFGTINSYEYLLPEGWKIGAIVSDGTNWIPGSNSVTVTSDLSHGINGKIYFRPANDCGAGFANGSTPGYMPINRPEPILTITGSTDYICSGNATYTLNGMPPGSSIQWSLSTNLNASITSTDFNTATVTRITQNNVFVNLIATVTACSGTYTVSHKINLGKPFYTNTGYQVNGISYPIKLWNGSSSDYNQICINQTAQTQFAFSGAQNVNWQRTYTNPGSLYWYQNGDNISTYFFAGNQYERFLLTASNVCGAISNTYGFSSKICGGGGGCLVYQVSPNPATNTIQVGVAPNIPAPCDPQAYEQSKTEGQSSDASASNKRSIQSISIYDNNGRLKQRNQYSANNKKATMDISKLPAGLYTIRITDGSFTESQQVIIKN